MKIIFDAYLNINPNFFGKYWTIEANNKKCCDVTLEDLQDAQASGVFSFILSKIMKGMNKDNCIVKDLAPFFCYLGEQSNIISLFDNRIMKYI